MNYKELRVELDYNLLETFARKNAQKFVKVI